jgi:hypothetical protein
MVKWFEELIDETLGETSKAKKDKIENLVRDVIFHSTLDWQTKKQLVRAIKEANQILENK